jgi:shikimate dehydrogenase
VSGVTQPTIGGGTGLLAILGDPIAHAQAPTLVNAALAARGLDAVLVPLHVRAAELARVVAALRAVQNFRGAVVTMPHKEAAAALLDELSPEAREVGACNVIRRDAGGRLKGTMLDGEGFVAALRRAGHEPRAKRVFLAGAGGAAGAIAFALARHGAAALTIHNRTAARGEALASRLRAARPGFDVRVAGAGPAAHDLAINATSLGLRDGDALPFDARDLRPETIVAEIVIRATPLLAEARRRGCPVVEGRPMLEEQVEQMVEFILR